MVVLFLGQRYSKEQERILFFCDFFKSAYWVDDVRMVTWKKRRTTSIAAWVERAVLRSRGSDN